MVGGLYQDTSLIRMPAVGSSTSTAVKSAEFVGIGVKDRVGMILLI